MQNNQQKINLSVIIPCFNESETIVQVITGLRQELAKLGYFTQTENFLSPTNHEIIIINDASNQKTQDRLKNINEIKIIDHPYHKGYGSALKTGAKAAKYDWLLFFDADGQHNPEDIKNFLDQTENFDLIAGKRVGYQGPLIRQPGKKILHLLALYLLGQKVEDLNCGLRLVKKKEFLKFAHILPNGFSCSTTTVFAFLREKLNVKFVPVKINKRDGGKSLVRPKESFIYFMLIIRLIMLFSPLRVFLPISILLFTVALLTLLYDIFLINEFHNMTIGLLLFSSIMIFFFGLLADQVAALRREIS